MIPLRILVMCSEFPHGYQKRDLDTNDGHVLRRINCGARVQKAAIPQSGDTEDYQASRASGRG